MYFREVTEEQARARNLLISIAKGLHNEDEIGGRYMIDEIRTRFYFSKRDIKYQLDTFFDSVEEAHYVLRPSIGAYLAKVLRAHNCACSGLEAAESIFVKRFGQLRNAVRSNHYGFTPEMRKTYAEIQKLVPILHWGRLPIISKYLMINSELIPEENLTEFYDGFDMLEALLNDIYGKGESMEMNGDQTLGKELTFSVFCRRWGHTDSYRMQRTISLSVPALAMCKDERSSSYTDGLISFDSDVEIEEALVRVAQEKINRIAADVGETPPVITKVRYISDFAENDYTLFECEPSGYLIYNNAAGTFVESSAISQSPYIECEGDLYYAGVLNYYYQDADKDYVHTETGYTIDASAEVRAACKQMGRLCNR